MPVLPSRPAWLPDDAALARHYGAVARYPSYRLRLTEYLARLLPERGPCTLLDVGAGDGSLGGVFQTWRPETSVVGVETFVRDRKWRSDAIPLVQFDGDHLPFGDRRFDDALLSNVLHHTGDPRRVLHEVRRVTRRRIIIKDHLARGTLDRWKLAALDIAGNRRFGASTTGDYLDDARWAALFAELAPTAIGRHDALSFRTGAFERAFPNRLEIIFTLDFA